MKTLEEAKKDILSRITKDRLIEVSRELVAIPSETGNEKAVSHFMGNKLKEMGLDVKWAEGEKDRPNCIGILHGTTGKPNVQFSGHLDTVGPGDLNKWKTDPYGGAVIGNLIYGLGVMDSKGGGTASVIVALEALIASGIKLKGDISVVGTVDEEIGGRLGMHYLFGNGIVNPDLCIYCVHSDMEIKAYFKGLTQYKLTVRGQTAHGSTPKEGVNAINGAIKILAALESGLPYQKHRVLGDHTVNYGWIKGGQKYNVVCDHCEAGIDMRLVPGQSWQMAVEHMEKVIADLKKKDPDLDASIEVIQDHDPVELSEDDSALKIVSEAAKEIRGEYPKISGTIAAGDLAAIFKKGGTPAIGYGPGDLKRGNAHKENEFLEIDQLIDASKVYATIMLNTCY